MMSASTARPPSSPPPESLPGFEVACTVERMLGRPELWWQAVALFVEHFADWEKQWTAAATTCDEQRCVHALRSAAANVGAHHLACIASVLETLLNRQIAGDTQVQIPFSVRQYLRESFRQLWQTAAHACFGASHPWRQS